MTRRIKSPNSINTGVRYVYLVAGLTLLLVAVAFSVFEGGWPRLWLFLVLGALLIHSAFYSQIYLNDHILRRRNIFLRWQTFNFDQLEFASFPEGWKVELRFGGKRIQLSDLPKKKQVVEKLKQISRERIPFFGYRHAYRSELGHHEKCGCVSCMFIFEREDVKQWKTIQIKLLHIPLSKPKRAAICPNCRAEDVIRATEPSVPISQEGLRQMRKLYVSSLPDAVQPHALRLDSVRNIDRD